MKNQKTRNTAILIAVIAMIVFFSIFFLLSKTLWKPLTLHEILPYQDTIQFSAATLSQRTAEKGTVIDLYEITSDDDPQLSQRAMELLQQYDYKETSRHVVSGDFISISFAYSETKVTRIEVYNDGSVLVFSDNTASTYLCHSSLATDRSPFAALYEYLIGEPS